MPKVKRSAPVIASMPTKPSSPPIRAHSSPFTTEFPVTLAITERPITKREKYSVGPNRRPIIASGYAIKMRQMSLKVSPRVEA